MKLKAAYAIALAAAGMTLAAQPALARDKATARSLNDVETIRVDADLCPMRVSNQLNQHGFLVTSAGRPDAVLKLDVDTTGGLWDQDSMDEGEYSATLVGRNGRVLFRSSGYADNINLGYLCDEIGEEIASELEAAYG